MNTQLVQKPYDLEPTVALGDILHRRISRSYKMLQARAGKCGIGSEHYVRNNLLDKGRADFCQAKGDLSAEDLVLLYCCQYLQMHIASSCYVLQHYETYANGKIPFLNARSVVVDLGCGPLTFGLALAMHQTYRELGLGNLRYVGIDRAPAMLRKAEEFAADISAIYPSSSFSFGSKLEDIVSLVNNQMRGSVRRERLVFNCSYFFASTTLDIEDLFSVVCTLIDRHPFQKCIFIFQNPNYPSLNTKWDSFKRLLVYRYGEWNSCPSNVSLDYKMVDFNRSNAIVSKPPIKLSFELFGRQLCQYN